MSKGYMAKVAEALGVEIGEVFKISKENSNEKFTKYFRITHDNIEESEYQFLYSHWDTCNSEVLLRLLNGSLTLHKLSWKPKVGETYYMPWLYDCDLDCIDIIWNGTSLDEKRYASGFVCRTMKEALELAGKMLAVTKEGKNNG